MEARVAQVIPDVGPRLGELHGLGEARLLCEDLVADIRSAQAGRIPWSAVDRGLLLVGAPGTGKTTHARALAKECGIKFVKASAASWQSAGALDSHIRAMRADFAEARRYAPAILFIDEIDAIGSREQLSGHNAQYQTEVIDALLEQIQGIDTVESLVVVGATNYVENVDPALRRAGRLDQVVEVPLPNVVGLEQIFGYYLEPYRERGELADDVSARVLAELAWGLTGADVSFVTIVPRTDGSLGFVASVPDEGHVQTRRALLERLETVLAGRAAEEIVYGADEVSTGAGGPGRNSDLAVATRIATQFVCQSGLGDDGALHWTETATAEQERQIATLLAKSYAGVLARLQANRGLLDRIVSILEQRQELSGAELRGPLDGSTAERLQPLA